MSLDQNYVEKQSSAAFVVRDYTHTTEVMADASPMLMVVPANDILEFLDGAKKEGKKVAVYELGKRVLDWS